VSVLTKTQYGEKDRGRWVGWGAVSLGNRYLIKYLKKHKGGKEGSSPVIGNCKTPVEQTEEVYGRDCGKRRNQYKPERRGRSDSVNWEAGTSGEFQTLRCTTISYSWMGEPALSRITERSISDDIGEGDLFVVILESSNRKMDVTTGCDETTCINGASTAHQGGQHSTRGSGGKGVHTYCYQCVPGWSKSSWPPLMTKEPSTS